MVLEIQAPFLVLALTPLFNEDGAIWALDISISIEAPEQATDTVLVSMPLRFANVPMQHYDAGQLIASDAAGALPLQSRDHDSVNRQTRTWLPTRPTQGDVCLYCRAYPRLITPETRIGPRVDLRAEAGGLLGAGMSFLPLPPIPEGDAPVYQLSVVWNLGHAPLHTRAVWTFGEGPHAVTKLAPTNTLAESVYCVGPIRSYPDRQTLSVPATATAYGFYWFADPPGKILDAGRLNEDLFGRMARFMHEEPSTAEPYRVFVRSAAPARGFGGGAYQRSYILEYDDRISVLPKSDIFLLLAHEMVHNFCILGNESPSDQSGATCDWYTEGTAEYYSLTLPFREKLMSESSYMQSLNDMLAASYTNPDTHLSLEEADNRRWVRGGSFAGLLPYKRGCVYIFAVDSQIRHASSGARSFDHVMLELRKLERGGKHATLADYLRLLQEELGDDAVQQYHDMAAGKTIVIRPDSLPGWRLVRQDQYVFEWGFDYEELASASIISGLKPGSRAAQAGLLDGDRVVTYNYLQQCLDHYHQENVLEVVRHDNGKDKHLVIKYWPHSHEKAESYQFLPAQDRVADIRD